MFVTGYKRNDCEVFDNICKKIVNLKPSEKNFSDMVNIITIVCKLLVFKGFAKSVFCYDVGQELWSTKKVDRKIWLYF